MRWSAVWLAAAACSSGPPSQSPTVTKLVTNDVDVMFVIQNTQIADLQALLGANISAFVQTLDAFPMGRPNLHIGVVTSTVGTGGMAFPPSCPAIAPDYDGLLQN